MPPRRFQPLKHPPEERQMPNSRCSSGQLGLH